MKPINENMPEFPLRPYDRLKPRTQTPRAMATSEINGRRFDLRCEQCIVFFREPFGAHPDYIFAILPRIEHRDAYNPDAVKAFFELHYQENNIARFHLHHYSGAFDRDFPLFFGANGDGVCREFYNEDDIPFHWQAHELWKLNGYNEEQQRWITSSETLTPEDLEAIAEKIVYHQIIKPLLVTESSGFPFEPLTYLCGSKEELEQVARMICYSHPALFLSDGTVALSFSSENDYNKAHLTLLVAEDSYGVRKGFNFRLDENDELQIWTLNREDWRKINLMPFSQAIAQLFELALDYNTPSGVHWEYHDCGSGRAAYSPSSYSDELYFVFDKPTPDQTRAARNELRQWLKGKVPDEEIKELLR